MLDEIKTRLLEDPESIISLLETFGFEHIVHRNSEIRFARNSDGGANISIRLKDNPYCCVSDWSRGVSTDIISYIIREKNVSFRDVLQTVKKILGLGDDWYPKKSVGLFGGLYANLGKHRKEERLKTYDDSILDKYIKCGNLRFLRDGISIEAQRFWDIRFSIDGNAIIIPIRNEVGELVGTKARVNHEAVEGESKYYYPVPLQMSKVLYGYSENFQYLYGDDVIVAESEKTVCQAYTFGIRNVVALGSSSVSEKQSKLLLQLCPKRIILAFDEGLAFEQIKRNADMIKNNMSIFDIEIWYWDTTLDLDIGEKCSITDMGKEKFEEIIEEQLVRLY